MTIRFHRWGNWSCRAAIIRPFVFGASAMRSQWKEKAKRFFKIWTIFRNFVMRWIRPAWQRWLRSELCRWTARPTRSRMYWHITFTLDGMLGKPKIARIGWMSESMHSRKEHLRFPSMGQMPIMRSIPISRNERITAKNTSVSTMRACCRSSRSAHGFGEHMHGICLNLLRTSGTRAEQKVKIQRDLSAMTEP